MDPAKKKRVLKLLAGREADRAQALELLVALGDDDLWREALAQVRTIQVVGMLQIQNEDLSLVAAAPAHLPEAVELRSRHRSMYFSHQVLPDAACLTHLEEVHLTAAWGRDLPVPAPSLGLLHGNPVAVLSLIGVDLEGGEALRPFPLRQLKLSNCTFSGLPALPGLEVLSGRLRGAATTGLGFGLPGLRRLDLQAEGLRDLSALAAASRLEELSLRGVQELADLEPLAQAIRAGAPLREVRLIGAARIASLDALEGGRALERVEIAGAEVGDLSPLADAAGLRWLAVREARSLSDLGPVSGLRELRCLDLRGCGSVRALEPALALPRLRAIALHGTGLGPADVPPETRPYCTWAEHPVLEELAARPVHPDDARGAA